MGDIPNTIHLYTASYPYGKEGEPYLEAEIKILASQFKNVVIFPFEKKSNYLRTFPTNVVVNDLISESRKSKTKFANLKWLDKLLFVRIVFSEMMQNRMFLFYLKNIRDFGYLYAEACQLSKVVHQTCDQENISVIHYSYWFDYIALSLAVAKKKKLIDCAVSRVHGFDLYDSRSRLGVQPFRYLKTKYMNAIFPVSIMGEQYFKSRIHKGYWNKVNKSYLGVNNDNCDFPKQQGNQKNIVSCSTIIPLKRLWILIDALKKVEVPVQWVHLGDGPELESLKVKCEQLPAHIKVNWKGKLTNQEVYDFYQNQYVDLFVNCSYSEGLPVSMMEAISFGIPILSFDVGGISEIVTAETGYLVNDSQDVERFGTALKEALSDNSLDRNKIRSHYERNFDAHKNYSDFVIELKALYKKRDT